MGLLGSIGKIVGGASTSKSKQAPWGPIQGDLIKTAEAGARLFANGKLSPDNVGFSDTTKQGLSSIAGLARNNGVTSAAAGGLTGFLGADRFQQQPGFAPSSIAGPGALNVGQVQAPANPMMQGVNGPQNVMAQGINGPSSINVGQINGPSGYRSNAPSAPGTFGGIGQNDGIQAVRDRVTDQTLSSVASMFGRGGFSNSTTASSAAADALGSALAPYEYDQINRNQQLNLNQFNTEQDRGLAYGFGVDDRARGQFNTETDRQLGFDINERNMALGQENTDQARRLSFDTQQQALNLGQDNVNADRQLGFDVQQQGLGLNQANINADRNLAFDVGERNLALGQQNTDMDRRLGFETQQQGVNLNQQNIDANRNVDREALQGQQYLSALGLAPAVNSLQYGDAQSLLGVGQLRDQNRLANKSNASNEVLAAASLFGGLGGLGGTSTNRGSPLDTIGKLGQTATSLFSGFGLCDRRLKRDITRVATWRGVAIYTFRYLWDDVLRIGPMAQEVPERARIDLGGFYAVDMEAI